MSECVVAVSLSKRKTGSNPTWGNINMSRFFNIIGTPTTVHVYGAGRISSEEAISVSAAQLPESKNWKRCITQSTAVCCSKNP